MAIRIRKLKEGVVALCAAETDQLPDDLYLDDEIHYALAAKFARDWQGRKIDWKYPEIWDSMDSQKLRDAEIEIIKWIEENQNQN